MRPTRMTIVLLMMALGSLGAWLGVCAQDRRTPWPSGVANAPAIVEAAPVAPASKVVTAEQQTETTITSATPIKTTAVKEMELSDDGFMPPRELPNSITVTSAEESVAQSGLPPKLPAELPKVPHKAQATPPRTSTMGIAVETVKLPETPVEEAPMVVVAPPEPSKGMGTVSESSTPFGVPQGVPPVPVVEAPDVPEPLPLPRKMKEAKPVESAAPMFVDVPKVDVPPIEKLAPPPMVADVPKVEPGNDKPAPPAETAGPPNVFPPMGSAEVPPLPMFTEVPKVVAPERKSPPPPVVADAPKPTPPMVDPLVPPLPMFADVPKVTAPPEIKVAAPPVQTFPKVETPAHKNSLPPPTAGIDAKPLSVGVQPKKTTVTAPVVVPEPAPPSVSINVPMPQALPTQPAVEAKAPEVYQRPPAFQIVKPRRVEPPPQAVAPAPSLLEAPRAAPVPLASSAAQVSVEKRGPSVLRQGVATSYQIIVRNRGASASGPVTVVDEIPQNAKQVTGDPSPAQLGDKVIWTLPPLPANSETVLKLELQASSAGEFVGNTTVFVSAATATTRAQIQHNPDATTVAAGPLGVFVRSPVAGAVGQPVVFEVQITNRGKQLLNELVLHASLGDGFMHPSGNQIEADVGDLAPGASKTFKMPTTALRSGRQTVEVKITAAGGVEVKAKGAVLISGNSLSIQTPPTSRLLLDREGELRIDVTNLQAESLRNVQIADTLPENFQFVSASDRGIFQASTRTVQWLVDELPAGETRTVTLRVQGKKQGQFAQEVSASADSLPATRVQSVVQVEGFANLNLKVTPREQPLGVGKETVVEVRIQNLGNLPANGVQLQIELPPGLASGHVQGPTAHRLQGRTLIFEPIAKLPAQTQAVVHLGVAARAAGDQRIRAQVVSDLERTPMVREAPLQVYRE